MEQNQDCLHGAGECVQDIGQCDAGCLAKKDAAEHQCCGKCEKPAESVTETVSVEGYENRPEVLRAVISDLAQRLQTADLLVAALVGKAGGGVTLVEAEVEAVLGKNVVSDADHASTSITFRLVDEPAEQVQ